MAVGRCSRFPVFSEIFLNFLSSMGIAHMSSVAHCFGILTVWSVSFLIAEVSSIFRMSFCRVECVFRDQFLAGDIVKRHWNRYFFHVLKLSSAHHDPG